jgi:hypothetical protein
VGGEETTAVEGDEEEETMVRPSLMRNEGSAVAKVPLQLKPTSSRLDYFLEVIHLQLLCGKWGK